MDHHLDGEGGLGNSRNGYGRKTVTTRRTNWTWRSRGIGGEELNPQLIAKYQRRFPGFDDKILPMYARGMSIGGDEREAAAEEPPQHLF